MWIPVAQVVLEVEFVVADWRRGRAPLGSLDIGLARERVARKRGRVSKYIIFC